MSVAFRSSVSFGLVSLSLLGALALRAAEEPAGDLAPILPRTRMLFPNDDSDRSSPARGQSGSPSSLSADGKWMLLTDNNSGMLMLSDLSATHPGQPRPLRIGGSPGGGNVTSALSADGKIVALMSPQDGENDLSIHFFSTDTGKLIRDLDNDQPIFSLAFSPDGQILAVGTQERIELWKAEDGDEFRLFPTSENANYRLLTFSPDGRMIAALGAEPDVVHIWEVASGKERASIRPFGSGRALAVAGQAAPGRPMRAQMLMRGMGGVLDEGYSTNEGILALAFSPDSRLLAISKPDSSIHLWDLQTNRELPPLTGFRGLVNALVFGADGKELIAVDNEGTRLSWSMAALRRNSNVRLAPLDDADFAELWNDLAEPDPFRNYRAQRHLVTDPKRAVGLLSRHLEPVPPGETARIEQLIKDLTSSNGGKRRKAMTELRTKHGEAALGALLQKYNGGNAAVPGGLPGLMQAIAGAAPAAPAEDVPPAILLLLQKLQTKYNTPERQRDLLAVLVLEEIGTPQAKQALRKLSKGAAGVSLTTEAKAALDRLAASAKQESHQTVPKELWSDLAVDDAPRAYRAIRRLTSMPKQAVSFLGERLKPVPVVQEKELVPLLANLESDDYRTREQASATLEKAGEQAIPLLKKALEGKPALEARKRIEQMLDRLTQQTPVDVLQRLRAIEVLERIGTAEAKSILSSLSGGAPQVLVTCEAKASLKRLARR